MPQSDLPNTPRKPGRPHRQPKVPSSSSWPEATPFAHLLATYAYEQRTREHPRPLNASEIGQRSGYSRQTVNNWLTQGIEPPLMTMVDVCAKLGIPTQRLLDVYHIAYTELYASPPPAAPTPADIAAHRARTAELDKEEWELALRNTELSLSEAGMSDEFIRAFIQHMRDANEGYDPMARRREEEWNVRATETQKTTEAQRSPTPKHS